MSLRVKLFKSFAGAPDNHLRTIRGLGLRKMGQVRVLQDTPAIRGMVFKVKHLVSHEVTEGQAPAGKRHKPRKIAVRDRARAGRKSP
jgi:large subunit ribosomal protein L30